MCQGGVLYRFPPKEATEVKIRTHSDLAEEIIKKLNQCENGGRWDQRAIVDTNGKYSYGGLQFQFATFKSFGLKYGVIPADWDDARIIENIYRQEMQTAIAGKMIDDGLGSRHWVNCWRIMGLKQKPPPHGSG